jgi:hypothetical protein
MTREEANMILDKHKEGSMDVPHGLIDQALGLTGDLQTYKKTLEHLIWMAGMKGAKQYAWDRAKKLDADPSGAWRGIADDLTKAMNAKSGKD